MKNLDVGSHVRVSRHLHGSVVELTAMTATVAWVRIKGRLQREARRRVPRGEIIPSDATDQREGIPWRLQFFIDDGRGRALGENRSEIPAEIPKKPWTPHSPPVQKP